MVSLKSLVRKCLVRLGGKRSSSAVVLDVILIHNLLSLVVKMSQILYFSKQYPDFAGHRSPKKSIFKPISAARNFFI